MELSLQYIAGFFDGEGCIFQGRRLGELRVGIYQKDRRPLDLIQLQFGGNIYLKKDGVHQHHISGNKGLDFLEAVLPYLIVKRDKAREVLIHYGRP